MPSPFFASESLSRFEVHFEVPLFALTTRIAYTISSSVAAARHLDVAVQIVRIEDRAHIAQAVPGDGCDFGFGASNERESRYSGAAQIIEGDVGNRRLPTCLSP